MGVDEVHHRAEAQPVDHVAERAADDGAERDRHQARFGAAQPDAEADDHGERDGGEQQVAPLAEARSAGRR